MASTRINTTLSGSGVNTKKWTFSAWVKKNALADGGKIFSAFDGGNYYHDIKFNTSDRFVVYCHNNGNAGNLQSKKLFKDPNAWYHVVVNWDTAQSNQEDRCKMWVNNERITEWHSVTYPAQNVNGTINDGYVHTIGAGNTGSYGDYFNGCMSHINFAGNQSYDPTTFGEVDSTDGMWKIKTSPSVNYTQNGFFLKMQDSSNMDLDSSGNSQSFTTTGNLTATKDNPSNNFSTWNPLVTSLGLSSPTFLNGNTFLQAASNTPRNYGVSSLAMPKTGKYFSEHKIVTNNDCIQFGICNTDDATASFQSNTPFSSTAYGMMYVCPEGKIEYNLANEITGLATAGNNDIVGLGIDMDDEKMYIYVNGTLANTGGTSFAGKVTGDFLYMCTGDGTTSGNDSVYSNFGNGYFGTTAITSAGTNASNNGIFEYNVPAGFTALSTKGLNE